MGSASEFSFEALEPLVAAAPAVQVRAPSEAAADVLARAGAEAERLRASAQDEGYRDGYAAGQAAALEEARPAAAALRQAESELRAAGHASAQRLEAESVDFALALAEKILAAALAVRPELVLDAIRQALRGIVDRDRITVLVHPDDLRLVAESMAAMQSELGGIDHWEVQAERRVQRGGAIVRHAHGDVDAQVQSKLARARDVVEAAMSGDA